MSDRTNVLGKVRALLDKAESTTFSAERDALLAKADALMLKYAIESHELVMQGKAVMEEPELRTFTVCKANNPLREQLVDLVTTLVRASRGRHVFTGLRYRKDVDWDIKTKVVAFPSDLDYLEMLFTSLQLQLANEMEPKPVAGKSDVENATTMKAAGMTWDRIVELLGYTNFTEDGKPTPERRRVIHGWRRHVKTQDPETAAALMNQNPGTYQRSYAEGFVAAIANRFWEMERKRRDEEAANAKGGTGTALVLADRAGIVTAKYQELFPNVGAGPRRKEGRVSRAGYARGADAGRRADISGGRGRVTGGRGPALPSG